MANKQSLSQTTADQWAKRRDIPIAILGWVVLLIIVVWGLHYISDALIMFLLAVFLAYALYPAVRLLERFLPRTLAIVISYLVILTGLGFLIYFVVSTAVVQLTHLAHYLTVLLTPTSGTDQTPLLVTLKHFGISQQQMSLISQQVTQQAERITSSIVPFLSGIFLFILDMLIVAVLSIYLLIDGIRVKEWLQHNAPKTQHKRLNFILGTLERIIGGYIRGQVLLALTVSLLVTVGLLILHVPYAVLLGVLTFLLEFVPILGTLISGAICVLLALTQGWLIAVIVLVYFIVLHVIEGDILGPRIVGKAIGLHPVVSIVALIAGSELFGIIGALFAAPVAGILQVLLIALWTEWKTTHPEEFAKRQKNLIKQIGSNLGEE
jgi:predicted PurR-regulated permease PerM